MHILGYFLDFKNKDLVEALARFRQSRLERAKKMLAKLRALGIIVSWEQVLEMARGETVGRPHIARALQEADRVQTTQEAFDRFLDKGRPAWHVTSTIPHLAAEGLVGLETYYPGYNPLMVAHLCGLAKKHHLICTGGSDFHGLGLLPERRLGQVYVPPECVSALKDKTRSA